MMSSRIREDQYTKVAALGLPGQQPQAVEESAPWDEWREKVEHVIGEYPGAALGIALAAGILLGWWTKRS